MTKSEKKTLERNPQARLIMRKLIASKDGTHNAQALTINHDYSTQDALADAGWIDQRTNGVARYIVITPVGRAKFS